MSLLKTSKDAAKKKRGRPKKNDGDVDVDVENDSNADIFKILEKSSEESDESDSSDSEEEIILHMPISFKDVDNIDSSNTSIKDTSSTEKPDKKATKKVVSTTIKIDDMSCDDSSDDYTSYDDNTKDLVDQIKSKNETIRKQEKTIEDLKKILCEYTDPHNDPISVHRIVSDLIVLNKDGNSSTIVEKTDLACMWCRETFDTPPCYVPDKYIDDKFQVLDFVFCSESCGKSYIVDIGDHRVSERISLQVKLHNAVYVNNQISCINYAPPREAHIKVGGYLTTKQFRKNSNTNKVEYRHIMPPMTSIITYIEKTIDEDPRLKRIYGDESEDNLVLKRSKPLPNSKNTLIDTIGLRVM